MLASLDSFSLSRLSFTPLWIHLGTALIRGKTFCLIVTPLLPDGIPQHPAGRYQQYYGAHAPPKPQAPYLLKYAVFRLTLTNVLI